MVNCLFLKVYFYENTFLASGNGGTIKFVHHAIKELKIDAKIIGVISDRECGYIEYARKNGILVHTFRPWREKLA